MDMKKILTSHTFQAGFSLVEMLVVIAILGIMAGAVAIGYGSVQADTRDHARLSDLEQISLALNLYRQDTGAYPSDSGVVCSDPRVCTSLNAISQVVDDLGLQVADPLQGTGGFNYRYNASESCGGSYNVVTLRATVESESRGNLTEQQNRCSSLSGTSNEYILILDFFE